MEYKSIQTQVNDIQDRTVTGLAAITGNVDTYWDIIHRGAFKKTIKENAGRVRHLWQHDMMQPPVAAVRELREVDTAELPDEVKKEYPDATGGLIVVREYLRTPRGDEILEGIRTGAISEMSIGYDPVKYDFAEIEYDDRKLMVRNLREVRIWDTSDVNWGANNATIASKAAVPYKDTGIADEGEEWSAPRLTDFTEQSWDDLSESERRRIAAHYAWVVSMPPEKFTDCKLPHHKAEKTGVGKVVWRGCAAAMGALMGARGGVDIPEGDVEAVYKHLARHYEQFDKVPPEMKLVRWSYLSRLMLPELKEGRVLSARNLERLKNALEVLEEILLAAEPPDDEKSRALTGQVLRRLAIATRDPIFLTMR